jgi:hypothetical protein
MHSDWITHRETRIFHSKYANLDAEALKAEISAVESQICSEPLGSVLELTDLSGIRMTPQVTDWLKLSATRKRKFVRREAAVITGLTGVKRTLLEMIARLSGMPITIFEQTEDAKDWLAEQA